VGQDSGRTPRESALGVLWSDEKDAIMPDPILFDPDRLPRFSGGVTLLEAIMRSLNPRSTA